MKYEKAAVEIISFEDLEWFMILSSGKTCFWYGVIVSDITGNSHTCYDVHEDQFLQNYDAWRYRCNEVLPYAPYTELVCSVFNPCNGFVIP